MSTAKRWGLWLLLGSTLQMGDSCSGWMMQNNYSLSGRTLDNEPTTWIGRRGTDLVVVPRGTPGALIAKAKYGFLGFSPRGPRPTELEGWIRFAGLNEAGLSCDEQHLDESSYEEPSGNSSTDLETQHICEWAVMSFRSIGEVQRALAGLQIVRGRTPEGPDSGHHYTFRDADGTSLVLEIIAGKKHLHIDLNDDGHTGFGVITNSPPFDWHLTSLRLLQGKFTSARPGVAMPGNWYPDDRFQRIWLVKSAMLQPGDLQEAVSQAITVMNVASLPAGAQLGTDTSRGEQGDYTMWAAVYDHMQPTVYWRSALNPQIQRLQLKATESQYPRSCAYRHAWRTSPWTSLAV